MRNRGRSGRLLAAMGLVGIWALLGAASPAGAESFPQTAAWNSVPDAGVEGASFEVVDADGVYYGEGEHPKSPAVVVADDVWAEIPEYRRILDEDLDDEDPEYHLLLKKATERFGRALEKVAKRDGYDMIGEVGAIEVRGDRDLEIPEITQDMIDLVTRG